MAGVNTVQIGPIHLGGGRPLVLIAGPCVIESAMHAAEMARSIRDIAAARGIPFIFKASYDKANRTSLSSYRGPGLAEGLRILARIKAESGVPILTDIHEAAHADAAADVADVLQIPAFLCRQTDLLLAAAATGRVVNVKKGQFLAPEDAEHIVGKLRSGGARGILLTERGTTFGYNNLVVDLRSIPTMRSFGVPVVFDATHSVQRPGGRGRASGGDPQHIPTLARAAVAAGADAVFLEVHRDPARALSDGPNALRLEFVADLLGSLREIHHLVRSGAGPNATGRTAR